MADVERLDRAVALLEEAVVEAAPRPRSAGGARTCDWPERARVHGLTWSEGHARAALRLAEELDDDALEPARCPCSPSSASTAAKRTRRARRACLRAGRRLRRPRAADQARAWRSVTSSRGRSTLTRARALLEARYEEERHTRRARRAPARSGTCPSSSYARGPLAARRRLRRAGRSRFRLNTGDRMARTSSRSR